MSGRPAASSHPPTHPRRAKEPRPANSKTSRLFARNTGLRRLLVIGAGFGLSLAVSTTAVLGGQNPITSSGPPGSRIILPGVWNAGAEEPGSAETDRQAEQRQQDLDRARREAEARQPDHQTGIGIVLDPPPTTAPPSPTETPPPAGDTAPPSEGDDRPVRSPQGSVEEPSRHDSPPPRRETEQPRKAKPTEKAEPTDEPRDPEPTREPTRDPEPTKKPEPPKDPEPTRKPTQQPEPTKEPTREPTKRPEPTKEPTREPTKPPTKLPTKLPTKSPAPDDDDRECKIIDLLGLVCL